LVRRAENDILPHLIFDAATRDPADPRFVDLRTQERSPVGQRAVQVDIAVGETAGGVKKNRGWPLLDHSLRRHFSH